MLAFNTIRHRTVTRAASVPIIDLFAGPGGLGEGFSAWRDARDRPGFQIALSIEEDPVAHQTLELRAFYRQFEDPAVIPELYYELLRSVEGVHRDMVLADSPREGVVAQQEAWLFSLGASRVAREQVRSRIAARLSGADPWVLLGGPPCQAYSLVGRSRRSGIADYVPEKDVRHFLYREYLQVIADHRPAVFVMENVKGLLSATVGEERIFERIRDDLQHPARAVQGRHGAGPRYRLHALVPRSLSPEMAGPADFLVRAEEHGIPQARHRIFVIGIREDVRGSLPPLPAGARLVPARDVIAGLPPLRSGLSRNDSAEAWQDLISRGLRSSWLRSLVRNGNGRASDAIIAPVRRRMRRGRGAAFLQVKATPRHAADWYLDPRLDGITHHETRTHIPKDVLRYLFAATFATVEGRPPVLRDFPKILLPAHRNARRGVSEGHFHDRFRVQLPDRPATTVTSHISKDGHYYIHWDPGQARSLTVREAARLQTFPDNYWFCGGRTAQYHQVGNAVPPLLARQIAECIAPLVGLT